MFHRPPLSDSYQCRRKVCADHCAVMAGAMNFPVKASETKTTFVCVMCDEFTYSDLSSRADELPPEFCPHLDG